MGWAELLLGALAGLLVLWLALVAALLVAARHTADAPTLRGTLRLLPDVVRLVRRLAADPDVPRGVRWRLGLLLAYLVLPVDLVPDFLPVIGYADDAVLVALVLRSVVRTAGAEALERHWPGTREGLAVIRRLAGLGREPGVHERHD
jgi:uncharacterized membrane protein YkvA (DUF1232 family)